MYAPLPNSFWHCCESLSLSLPFCVRVDLFIIRIQLTQAQSRLILFANEKDKAKNWKQNIFLIRAFSTFIQFVILGTCSEGIIYSVMAVLPVHIACYRPELLFKDLKLRAMEHCDLFL